MATEKHRTTQSDGHRKTQKNTGLSSVESGSVRNFVRGRLISSSPSERECVWALWEPAVCAVFQGPGGAVLASTGPAASMRGPILRRWGGEAILEEDRKLLHREVPVVARLVAPPGRDIPQREPNQFGRRLGGWKVAAGLDDFADPRVDALERIRRIDHAPDRGREGEERDDLRPGAPPGRHDGRKANPPRAAGEHVQGLGGGLGTDRRVDGTERGREELAIARTREVEAMAQEMDDAGLQGRQRKHGGQRLAHPLEAVG